ncbi:hypothetical protein L596_004058 [Steinernema carpocapsae]|uniref:Uncharacterized protein n=1 Tax=Steinernema carpocapsae TaxID=34508 RepID=A0A4U8UUN7_STECR|nr:hypothetical protein L596_004058 [Steinernema carpocapsae]
MGMLWLVKIALAYYYIVFYGRLHHSFVSKNTWVEMNSRIGNWKGVRNLELILMLLLAFDATCTTVELGNIFPVHSSQDVLSISRLLFLIFLFGMQWTATLHFFIGFALEPIPEGCPRKLKTLKNQFITCDEVKCRTCQRLVHDVRLRSLQGSRRLLSAVHLPTLHLRAMSPQDQRMSLLLPTNRVSSTLTGHQGACDSHRVLIPLIYVHQTRTINKTQAQQASIHSEMKRRAGDGERTKVVRPHNAA